MIEIAKLVATVVLFFGGSVLVSYCAATYFSHRRCRLQLNEGASLRLLGVGGAYRCHFVEDREDGIVVTSPIQADRFVPIRVGEKLLVQAPGPDCLTSFRTTVVSRDSDAHELVLSHPEFVRRTERRVEPRDRRLAGEDAIVDGEMATVVDLTAAGMCLAMRTRPEPGKRMQVVLPTSGLDAVGWALDSTISTQSPQPCYKVRMQFEEPLAGLGVRTRSSD